MRTKDRGALNFAFHIRAKRLGKEGKKNPYTIVLHYWVGQNLSNREGFKEE